MPKLNEEQISQARSVDLLDYLQAFEPGNVRKSKGSANEYYLVEHDSLKMSNGKWLGGATINNGLPNVDIGALQQSSAKVIRESAPDETPDRNVGVSATKFFMELEATVQEQMAFEPKSKKNKQSKLKTEESRLKFEQNEEKNSDNNEVESPSDTEELNNDTEHDADVDNTDPDKSDTADDLGDSDTTDNTAEAKEKPKQKKADAEASDETDDASTSETPPE
jgi:hypothetical protein